MLPGMLGGGGGESDFATGMLAGLGMRELSQVLGLSRRRGGQSAAQPSAATMMQGQLGGLDKLMILSKLQGAMGGGLPGMSAAPGGMPGAPAPLPPAPLGPAAGALPPLPGGLPGGAPMPLPGGPPPGAPGMPGMPGAMPAPGGAPGGGSLAMTLIQKMLAGAGGAV